MKDGFKKIEFREPSEWILSRLIDKNGDAKKYDLIEFKNGYSNKKASFFALFFSILASIIAYILDFDLYSINMGLFAYNTVLCAIVFANFEKNSYIFALFSTIFALIIQIIFIKLSFIALTFPFVLASIVLLKFYKN